MSLLGTTVAACLALAGLSAAGPSRLDASPAASPQPSSPLKARPPSEWPGGCLLVAPFENLSDVGGAGAAAAEISIELAERAGVAVLPVASLRALFKDTFADLPDGISPQLATQLALPIEADLVLYGIVEGRAAGQSPSLSLSVHLVVPNSHDVLLASTYRVILSGGEKPLAALKATLASALNPVLARLKKSSPDCFDPARLDYLRAVVAIDSAMLPPPPAAISASSSQSSAAAPTAVSASAASIASASPAVVTRLEAKPDLTAAQAKLAKHLKSGERFVLKPVYFSNRTEELAVDTGLVDLAAVLLAQPGDRILLEGFVDRTPNKSGDVVLSRKMAEAARRRLIELKVPEERVAIDGRGGEKPIAPNFSKSGRKMNRRLEVSRQ